MRLHRVLCRNRIERNRPGLSHTVTGVASTPDEPPRWPYGERPPAPSPQLQSLRMIPFFARANRGPAAMRVFVPERPEPKC